MSSLLKIYKQFREQVMSKLWPFKTPGKNRLHLVNPNNYVKFCYHSPNFVSSQPIWPQMDGFLSIDNMSTFYKCHSNQLNTDWRSNF